MTKVILLIINHHLRHNNIFEVVKSLHQTTGEDMFSVCVYTHELPWTELKGVTTGFQDNWKENRID
jgi:hypothetical protein